MYMEKIANRTFIREIRRKKSKLSLKQSHTIAVFSQNTTDRHRLWATDQTTVWSR